MAGIAWPLLEATLQNRSRLWYGRRSITGSNGAMRREGLHCITLGRAPLCDIFLWPISLGYIRWGKGALRWVGLRCTSPGRAARLWWYGRRSITGSNGAMRREGLHCIALGSNGRRLRIPLGWPLGRNSARNDRSLGNRARCIPRRNTRLLLQVLGSSPLWSCRCRAGMEQVVPELLDVESECLRDLS